MQLGHGHCSGAAEIDAEEVGDDADCASNDVDDDDGGEDADDECERDNAGI